MEPVIVRNVVDTFTNEADPNRRYQTKTRLYMRAGSPNRRYTWLYFPRPWPSGVKLTRARLKFFNGTLWAGSHTITAHRPASRWDVNDINWAGQPGAIADTSTIQKTDAAAGTEWDLDILPVVSPVTIGPWFGIRLTTNSVGTANWIHSAQASDGNLRPYAEFEWTQAPDEPDNCKPSGGRAVSVSNPWFAFDYNDVLGDTDIAAVDVQIGSTQAIVDAGNAEWKSGEFPTIAPEFNSAAPVVRNITISTTNLSAVITSTDAIFHSSDVGAAVVRTGIPVGATILSVQSATQATLSANATTTATSVGTLTKTYGGTAIGATPWWRPRAKDEGGEWSPWAPAVQYTRIAKGILTITSPASGTPVVYTPMATITWTFTGTTQERYQVDVALASNPGKVLWTTKATGTATSVTLPFGVIVDANATYIVTVKIWDTIDREETPGDPTYVMATRTFTVAYDAAVSGPTAFNASSDPILPIERFTMSRAATPDTWLLQRSDNAGATWSYVSEDAGVDLSVGGTNYEWMDATAAPYKEYTWRVLAVVAGRQSGTSNPTSAGEVRHLAPFLMRPDGTDVCVFLNPKRSRRNMDIQELHEPLAGPPVVVTQRLGGKAGSVSGVFIDEILPGVSADVMYERFMALRGDSGMPMIYKAANQSHHVAAYNFQDDVITDAEGIMYVVSFDWVEVPAT